VNGKKMKGNNGRIPELKELGQKYGLNRHSGTWQKDGEVGKEDMGVEVSKVKRNQYKDRHVPATKAELRANEVIKQPIGRVAKRGRPKRFTPTKLRNRINDYFTHCEKEDNVPSIVGLTLYIKMSRDQFYQYLKYPDYAPIMEEARLIIGEWCANDVYKTRGQAAGKIAYMKNIHQWSEKIESSNTNVQIATEEELMAKIAAFAPELLELVKNAMITNQIAHQPELEGVVIEATEDV